MPDYVTYILSRILEHGPHNIEANQPFTGLELENLVFG